MAHLANPELIDEAIQRHQSGCYEQAIQIYHQILKEQPNHVDALHLLGMATHQKGDDDRAVVHLLRAIVLNPRQGSFHNTLGQVLHRQGRLDKAAASLRKSVDLDPSLAQAHHNLASVLRSLGQFEESVVCDRQAVDLEPRYGNAHHGLGDSLQSLRRFEEAIASYTAALAVNEGSLMSWYAMGCAQSDLGHYAEAVDSFRRAVEIDEGHGPSRQNLGQALFKLGQIDQALAQFRRAQSIAPSQLSLTAIAVVTPASTQADHWSIIEARRALATAMESSVQISTTEVARTPVCSNEPLRVGYISSYFQHLHWMKSAWGLINHHDRSKFEIQLFSDAAASEIGAAYQRHDRDRIHNTSGLSNEAFARLIKDNGIHVLVDLNGYSRVDRLPALISKPAPVIVGWFNMHATSGLECFDYLIGDEHVLLQDEEAYYTEKVIRVPGCHLSFEVLYDTPPVTPPPCSTGRPVMFGCLGSQYKITTQVVGTWSKILKACPKSGLVLKNAALGAKDNREYIYRLFGEYGIDRERILAEGGDDHFKFIEKYAEIDLALDTFPYNGRTTTMESLWQGVPVLTFSGDRWASRLSATLLRNAGLGQFVARDRAEFIQKAIYLAQSPNTPSRLLELRTDMRRRLRESSVCDMPVFARNMEQIYREIWEQSGRESHLRQ